VVPLLAVVGIGLDRASATAEQQSGDGPAAPGTEWRTYGSNFASHRYSPLDQINRDNFNRLEIAWRL
jgi:glucose dehydrogenase